MQRRISSTVATSALGQVHYCACKDRVSMRFKDRWFAMGRAELPGFRDSLMQLLNDPSLVRRLREEALEEAAARGLLAASLPTLEELGEMAALIDASALILEAQAIAGAALEHGGPA